MSNLPEARVGIEIVTDNPNDGEGTAWIDSETYQAATPEQWEERPISFFTRLGENKLVISSEFYAQSMLKNLNVDETTSSESLTILAPLDLHIRTDGLYLYSPQKSRGICIPIEAIATSAPASAAGTEALRIDMIPQEIIVSNDDTWSDVIYHIIPAVHSSDHEIAAVRRDVGSNCSPTLQAILRALMKCQDHLPPPNDEPHPIISGGGVVTATGGFVMVGGHDGADDEDEVRIPELANFSGWVTSDNVDEVMRAHGMSNGDADAADEVNGDVEPLGQGAGVRRQREGESDGDRIVIWRRGAE